MTRALFITAFLIGALAILWIANIFLSSDTLGLIVTGLIALVYLVGVAELVRFRKATYSLSAGLKTLDAPIEDLSAWLTGLDDSLQNSVRLRVEGNRQSLPAPVITPYLTGLLVMLGLLGTFVGMVDTLKGAVVALEGTNELEAIRAGLAAPIEGLGLAFGTSVAGVAASAMLGLLSTISRRERLQVSHQLDSHTASKLKAFSATHQQQLAFSAIQTQAEALPAMVESLSDLAKQIEQMSERVGKTLVDNQAEFQSTISDLYQELNTSVDASLKQSLVDSSEVLGAKLEPMAQGVLSKMSDAALETQEHLIRLSKSQIEATAKSTSENATLIKDMLESGIEHQAKSSENLVSKIAEQIEHSNEASTHVSEQLQSMLAKSIDSQAKTVDALLSKVDDSLGENGKLLHNSAEELLEKFSQSTAQVSQQQAQQSSDLGTRFSEELNSLRDAEEQRGAAAVARLSKLESVVAQHIEQLGKSLEEPMTRLIDTASKTPKAAAEVIEKLRGEMSKNLERDNDLLAERSALMSELEGLSKNLNASSSEQRKAIDSLIERSAETLNQVGSQFGEHLESESSKLTTMVDHFANSSSEMASLGDAFSAAVTMFCESFSESNTMLVENLERIESSLEQSTNRSDEQLAYYVAQAREIIDHNLLAHKEIIDRMHKASAKAS